MHSLIVHKISINDFCISAFLNAQFNGPWTLALDYRFQWPQQHLFYCTSARSPSTERQTTVHADTHKRGAGGAGESVGWRGTHMPQST